MIYYQGHALLSVYLAFHDERHILIGLQCYKEVKVSYITYGG